MAANEKRNLTIRINGKEVTNNVASIQKEFFKLRREVNQLDRNSREYREGIKELSRVSGILQKHRADIRGTASQWQRVKEFALGYLGGNFILSGLRSIAGGFRQLIGVSTEFEKSQSELAALLGVSKNQMRELTADAKRLGAATKFTATEVNSLQQEYARLGFTQEEILDVTESTLNAAAAANAGLGETAAAVGASIRSFGLEATDTARVTDVMAKSFSSSALNLERWSETMKVAAPIAKAAGVEIETAAALAGKLADAGISGSVAGTALKKIFNELTTDGKSMQEVLEDVAAQLNGASSESERLAIAQELVGERGQAALIALAGQVDDIADLETALRNAGGTAEIMANTQLDNLSGAVTILGSQWEGFLLSLESGDGALNNVAKGVVGLAGSTLDWLTVQDKASDSLIKEQTELNLLVGQISDVNTANEDRQRALEQLQAQYPGFLENLDTETVTNQQLRDRLAEVNVEYTNRILLQRQNEKLEEAAGKLAELTQSAEEKKIQLQQIAIRNLAEQAAEGDKAAEAALRQLSALGSQEEKLAEIQRLQSEGQFTGAVFGDSQTIDTLQAQIELGEKLIGQQQRAVGQQQQINEKVKENLGLSQESADGAGGDTPQAAAEKLAAIQDAQRQAAAQERAEQQAAQDSEAAAKERVKAIEQEISDLRALQRVAAVDNNQARILELEGEINRLSAELNNGRADLISTSTISPQGIQIPVSLTGEEQVLQGVENIRQQAAAVAAEGAAGGGLLKELFAGQDVEQSLAQVTGYASQVADTFLGIRRDAINAEKDAELRSLDELREAKSISEEEYEKRKVAIQNSANKELQRDAISKAIINGLVAVTSTLAQYGLTPAFFAALPLIAATTTEQIKGIKKQKFEKGGTFLVGPRHSEGGMPVIDPRTGQVRAEVEGGEFIVRRNAVNRHTLPLLNAINSGVLPNVDFRSARRQSMMVPMFEEGGEFQAGAGAPQSSSGEMRQLLDGFNQYARRVEQWQRNLTVQNPLTDLSDAQERRDDLINVSSF